MQLLEPWFRTRQELIEIKRTQTMAERQKFADFFDMHGCLRCQTQDRIHAGEGLCTACHEWFANQLERAMRLRARGEFD